MPGASANNGQSVTDEKTTYLQLEVTVEQQLLHRQEVSQMLQCSNVTPGEEK